MKKRRQNAKVPRFRKKWQREHGRDVRFEQNRAKMSSALFKMAKRRRKAKDREMRKACSKSKHEWKWKWKCRNKDSSVDRISMLPDEVLGDNSVDRISKLPDEVLGLILSHLTVKEQMAFSILSHRWRFLWTLTTRLDFDGIDSLARLKKEKWASLEKEKLNYVSWVNHVLASRNGSTIWDFKVHFHLSKNDKGCIDDWFRYALARKVQTLELELNLADYSRRREERYVFPYKEICSNSIHFKQLNKILLDHVEVDDEALKFFLHNCPLLEDLSVSHSLELSTLSVTGPFRSLKSLTISLCKNLVSLQICDVNLVCLSYSGPNIGFRLQNLPMLVNLSVSSRVLDHMKATVMHFSGILRKLQTLDLHDVTNEFYFPVKMSNLKQLVVTTMLSGSISHQWLTDLIRSVPRLQKFVIKAWDYDLRFRVRELQRMKVRNLYRELREVEFVGFRGLANELEFVLDFVDNAFALKKIVLDPKMPCYDPYDHKFDENLYTEAEIIAIDQAKMQLAQKLSRKINVEFLSLF